MQFFLQADIIEPGITKQSDKAVKFLREYARNLLDKTPKTTKTFEKVEKIEKDFTDSDECESDEDELPQNVLEALRKLQGTQQKM